MDGVRVIFDHGWGLLRASNTQPVLVMRFEAANDEDLLAAYRSEVESAEVQNCAARSLSSLKGVATEGRPPNPALSSLIDN